MNRMSLELCGENVTHCAIRRFDSIKTTLVIAVFNLFSRQNLPSVLSDHCSRSRIHLYTFLPSFTSQWHLTDFCQSAYKREYEKMRKYHRVWSVQVKWFRPASHMLGGGAYHTLWLWGFHGNTCQSSGLRVPSLAEIEIEDCFFSCKSLLTAEFVQRQVRWGEGRKRN